MLRECSRVLEPGGRLAIATIELSEKLSDERRARGVELGPADVAAEGSLTWLVERAGFRVQVVRDGTQAFAEVLRERLESLHRNESALRREEGDEAVDAERDKRARMLLAIEEGLLRRTLLAAVAP